jgi:hypothetical protein
MRRRTVRPLTLVAVAVCLVLTFALAWAARVVDRNSNQRLLEQQVQQAAAALSGALPGVQMQLADAAQVAIDTDADPAIFERFVTPRVTGSVAAISLWRLDPAGGAPRQIALKGDRLELVEQNRTATFFSRLHPSDQLFVTKILPGSPARLGYAEMPRDDVDGLVVYAESALPSNRHVDIPPSSPFADLDFALYLGPRAADDQLVESTRPTPIRGRTATASVPFGDTVVTLVGSTQTQLAGGLAAALPWIVVGVGGGLAIVSGVTVEYFGRRRQEAERLARENERLYKEQRDISTTLQHALLPEVPVIGGVEVAARYLAGVAGMEVGGDWYDVIPLDERRLVFFVGDVSGRGLRAATTMASLRYAVRAYVAQGDGIETVVAKLGRVFESQDSHRFATVLAGELDLRSQECRLVSAGHFFPLLITGGDACYVSGEVAPPVGVDGPARPVTMSFALPPSGLLLAFTDGAVERKGEGIDVGLERFRVAAAAQAGPVADTIDGLLAAVVPDGANDDVVIVGLRWGD